MILILIPILIFLTILLILAAIIYSGFLKVLEEYEKKRVHYAVMLVLDGLVLATTGVLLAASTPTNPSIAVLLGFVVLFRSLSALGSFEELRRIRIRDLEDARRAEEAGSATYTRQTPI